MSNTENNRLSVSVSSSLIIDISIENVPFYRRVAEIEDRVFFDCLDCSAPLSRAELAAAVHNLGEQRGNGQNYIKGEDGKFQGSTPGSGSGSGAGNGFIGSGEDTAVVGSLGKIAKGIAIYGESAIMDSGEQEMYPDSIAEVKRGEPMAFDEADNGKGNPNF